ncbi:hypothetical protein BKA80DRAFT_270881 [Phyllosticta citrichinensis]
MSFMIPCLVTWPVGVWHCLISPSSRPAFSFSPPTHQPTIHLPMCLPHHTVTHVAIPSPSFSSSSRRLRKKFKRPFLALAARTPYLLAISVIRATHSYARIRGIQNHCFLFTCPCNYSPLPTDEWSDRRQTSGWSWLSPLILSGLFLGAIVVTGGCSTGAVVVVVNECSLDAAAESNGTLPLQKRRSLEMPSAASRKSVVRGAILHVSCLTLAKMIVESR